MDAVTAEARATMIRALCVIAKWPWHEPAARPRDFDADPGVCPAITSALVAHYLTSGVSIEDVRRELLSLTAREDERSGEIQTRPPDPDMLARFGKRGPTP